MIEAKKKRDRKELNRREKEILIEDWTENTAKKVRNARGSIQRGIARNKLKCAIWNPEETRSRSSRQEENHGQPSSGMKKEERRVGVYSGESS